LCIKDMNKQNVTCHPFSADKAEGFAMEEITSTVVSRARVCGKVFFISKACHAACITDYSDAHKEGTTARRVRRRRGAIRKGTDLPMKPSWPQDPRAEGGFAGASAETIGAERRTSGSATSVAL
jgi:hypothetical protein